MLAGCSQFFGYMMCKPNLKEKSKRTFDPYNYAKKIINHRKILLCYHANFKFIDAARSISKVSMRKQYVDELISYEKQEVEDIVKFVYLDETQKVLGAYFQSLKGQKK